MPKKESSKKLKKNVGGSSVIGGSITIGEEVLKSTGNIVSSRIENEADEAGHTGLLLMEGIGPAYSAKLKTAGITSIESLLKHGATSAKRKEISEATGISPELILEWVNRADIFRIKGVAEEYSTLLEAAGVDTVTELAQRRAENMYQRMVEINERKNLVRKLPTLKQVEEWIAQAKRLPRVVNY
jgi:predicted flap endonuclease-1-like 5' DNA nuclease